MSFFRSFFRQRFQSIAPSIRRIYASPRRKTATSSSRSAEDVLDYWLYKAIDMAASDIHFERYKTYLKVRYRIDGKLQTIRQLAIPLHSGMITRVKILANLKIDEKRIPQDGRFSLVYKDQKWDIRVSIIPGYFGECMVLRLLNVGSEKISLQGLGARPQDVQLLAQLTAAPNGMIVVAGPTGSGKSTTLYAIIRQIASPERKVITVEDPVEYQLPGISQVAVNEAIGMTFATALRSLLRQAPNIILVGEIRDRETAEIAVRAALTGHLVLTTVHAKNAINVITRFFDFDIPPYLIAATLRAVLSQRLVRTLCPHCLQIKRFDPEKFSTIAPEVVLPPFNKIRVGESIGCDQCSHTSYKGRRAIMEILPISENIRKMIDQRCSEDAIRQQAQSEGMETLRDIAIQHYLNGTLGEEALRSLLAEVA